MKAVITDPFLDKYKRKKPKTPRGGGSVSGAEDLGLEPQLWPQAKTSLHSSHVNDCGQLWAYSDSIASSLPRMNLVPSRRKEGLRDTGIRRCIHHVG